MRLSKMSIYDSDLGELPSKVPLVGVLDNELGFGGWPEFEDRRPTVVSTATNNWRKRFLDSHDYLRGDDLMDWKDPNVRRHLKNMAREFLLDQGQELWPDTFRYGIGPVPIYPQDEARLTPLLVQLFWKQNFQHIKNGHYNHGGLSRSTSLSEVDRAKAQQQKSGPSSTRPAHKNRPCGGAGADKKQKPSKACAQAAPGAPTGQLQRPGKLTAPIANMVPAPSVETRPITWQEPSTQKHPRPGKEKRNDNSRSRISSSSSNPTPAPSLKRRLGHVDQAKRDDHLQNNRQKIARKQPGSIAPITDERAWKDIRGKVGHGERQQHSKDGQPERPSSLKAEDGLSERSQRVGKGSSVTQRGPLSKDPTVLHVPKERLAELGNQPDSTMAEHTRVVDEILAEKAPGQRNDSVSNEAESATICPDASLQDSISSMPPITPNDGALREPRAPEGPLQTAAGFKGPEIMDLAKTIWNGANVRQSHDEQEKTSNEQTALAPRSRTTEAGPSSPDTRSETLLPTEHNHNSSRPEKHVVDQLRGLSGLPADEPLSTTHRELLDHQRQSPVLPERQEDTSSGSTAEGCVEILIKTRSSELIEWESATIRNKPIEVVFAEVSQKIGESPIGSALFKLQTSEGKLKPYDISIGAEQKYAKMQRMFESRIEDEMRTANPRVKIMIDLSTGDEVIARQVNW